MSKQILGQPERDTGGNNSTYFQLITRFAKRINIAYPETLLFQFRSNKTVKTEMQLT